LLLEEQMLRVKPQAVSAPDELPGRGREELAAGRQRPWALALRGAAALDELPGLDRQEVAADRQPGWVLALRGAAAHFWAELHLNSRQIARPRDSQDAPEAPVAVWLEAQPGPSG
jgi:hypothetical protein